MHNIKLVGVDIGGTKISAGLVENGVVVKKETHPTEPLKSRDEILNNLFKALDAVITQDTKAIGIGVPGIINAKEGIIHDLKNIPSWKEIRLKDVVQEKYKVDVYINNDANCFILGEKFFGQGKEFKNVIGLTLGTGLGTGIVVNNDLYTGLENGAGEFGMASYKGENFEHYCSGKFFKCVKEISGLDCYNAAVKGESAALEIWNEFGQHIGELVKVVLYSMAPELIVFGGSVAAGYNYFEKSMREQLNDFVLKNVSEKVQIIASDNNDNAVLGAAALYFIENK